MLATREDRRGQRIAFILGAQAIVHMWERHGARGFNTGVRADNAPSRTLCEKLGVCSTEWIYAQCIDRELFGGVSITK
jgi:RimJ/RimL family protein N-acetyltransferase